MSLSYTKIIMKTKKEEIQDKMKKVYDIGL